MVDDNTRSNGKRHGGGRPRTGSLVWRKAGWSARYWTFKDGEYVRVCVRTRHRQQDRSSPQARSAFGSGGPDRRRGGCRIETFEVAARAIVQTQADEGLKSWKDRVRRLTAWAFPAFGQLAGNAVRPPHVQDALDACCRAGKSRRTVTHLLVDISTVLDQLWRQELVPENVARKVRVPKNARVDRRSGSILADVEFGQFMACRDVSAELHVMALRVATARRHAYVRPACLGLVSRGHAQLGGRPHPSAQDESERSNSPSSHSWRPSFKLGEIPAAAPRQGQFFRCAAARGLASGSAERFPMRRHFAMPFGALASCAPRARLTLDGSGPARLDRGSGKPTVRKSTLAAAEAACPHAVPNPSRVRRPQAARLSLVPARLHHRAGQLGRERSAGDAARRAPERRPRTCVTC